MPSSIRRHCYHYFRLQTTRNNSALGFRTISNQLLYTTELFISFQLADPAGIIFFGHVFDLSHQVYELFILEKLQIEWKDWFQNTEWVMPIRATEALYDRPLIAGKKCTVNLFLTKLSPTSFTLMYQFFQDMLCCTVHITSVCCNKVSLQKRELPSKIREAFIESCNSPICY